MIDQLTYTKAEAIRAIGCTALVFNELVRDGLIRPNWTRRHNFISQVNA